MSKINSFIFIALLATSIIKAQIPAGAITCVNKSYQALSPQVLSSSACRQTVCAWFYQVSYNPHCVNYPCAETKLNGICNVCNNSLPINDRIAAYTLGACPATMNGVPFNATLCTSVNATKLKCPSKTQVCGYKDIATNPTCQISGTCKQTYSNYCDPCKAGSAGFLTGKC